MNRKKLTVGLFAGVAVLLLSGCGNEERQQYQQAAADLEGGYYEDAIAGYDMLLGGKSYEAEAYRGRGIAYYKLGDYGKAMESFEMALNQEDQGQAFQRDVLLYQAAACYEEGMYDQAADSCDQALEMKEDAQGWFLKGMIELERDAYEQAKTGFLAAYKKDSSYEMATQIYRAYVSRDMEADGTDYLEMALEKTPKNASDYCKRAQIYYDMQDYEKAKQELAEAMNQGSAEARLLLGNVYLAQKDIAGAKTMYQEYIEAESGAALGYNGLALCAMEEGNYAEALDSLAKGLRAAEEGEQQGLLYNEAVVYERQGDFAGARNKFEEYLKLYPEDEVAKKEYRFLISRTLYSATAEQE